jgi:hypothetical protein
LSASSCIDRFAELLAKEHCRRRWVEEMRAVSETAAVFHVKRAGFAAGDPPKG